MKIQLDSIRDCLDGIIPGNIATRSLDGTPNMAYMSQAQYVDSNHVALSYQFFNSTRRNILAFPRARISLFDPWTGAQYRLALEYLRTEDSGPIFESMKAKLVGIASHSGMSGVFRLLGSDIYRVLDIESVPGETLPPRPAHINLLAALRASAEAMCGATDLDDLLARTMNCMKERFDIQHGMVLMLDEPACRLYTVASLGYPTSGIGSEIMLDQGVIGVAARVGTPIRIGYFAAEYSYSRAIKASLAQDLASTFETEIPLPGLPESRSQLAVPIRAAHRVIGVLYVESPQEVRFSYDDEDALVALAGQLGTAIHMQQQNAEMSDRPVETGKHPAKVAGTPLLVRHYAENDSIFLGDDYLIKGVAGAIFWTLARDYVDQQRSSFTNRELRLDSRIKLPDLSDNLEARLLLLTRRLAEYDGGIRIEKTGRGRFSFYADQPLQLVEVPANRRFS